MKRLYILTLLCIALSSNNMLSAGVAETPRVLREVPPYALQKGKFIAAFNWSAAETPVYVWPFESMRPAPYDTVAIVIETMPRVFSDQRAGKNSLKLSPQRSLKINGRSLPRPFRSVGSQEEFLVPLVNGRLRFELTIPQSYKLDPEHAMVRIRMHEAV